MNKEKPVVDTKRECNQSIHLKNNQITKEDKEGGKRNYKIHKNQQTIGK